MLVVVILTIVLNVVLICTAKLLALSLPVCTDCYPAEKHCPRTLSPTGFGKHCNRTCCISWDYLKFFGSYCACQQYVD